MLFYGQLGGDYTFRIKRWIADQWNQFDILLYMMCIVAICLRLVLSGDVFWWARIMWSITLICFFLRSTQFFFAVQGMGPKVLMIKKMVGIMVTNTLTHARMNTHHTQVPRYTQNSAFSRKYDLYYTTYSGW
jgi:hypothetical protein